MYAPTTVDLYEATGRLVLASDNPVVNPLRDIFLRPTDEDIFQTWQRIMTLAYEIDDDYLWGLLDQAEAEA